MLSQLNTLTSRASHWLVWLGAFILAIMTVMTFVDVVGRYAFNSPIVGAVETTELFMGVIVYLGMAMTTQSRGHISVDLVTSSVGPRLRAILAGIADLVSTAFVLLLSRELWRAAIRTQEKNLMTQIWDLPVYPAAFVMAAASSLMAVILVLQTVSAFGQVKNTP